MAMVEPQASDEVLLYHEVQESRLCAVHCINAVLQGPYFSEVDLAALAHDLDQREQQMMLEGGEHSPHYLSFMAEGSSNVAADGNFSIQVLKSALAVWNLHLVSLESPEAEDAAKDPQLQNAFICHLQAHWFTIRKVGTHWYNFNSLYAAPEQLSAFYLAAYLDTLKSNGWSIFVVCGQFPGQSLGGSDSAGCFGRWLSPKEAEEIARSAKAEASSQAEPGDTQLAAAIAASLSGVSPTQEEPDEQEEQDLAAAIAASLGTASQPAASQNAAVDAAALAQALAQSFYSAAGATDWQSRG